MAGQREGNFFEPHEADIASFAFLIEIKVSFCSLKDSSDRSEVMGSVKT